MDQPGDYARSEWNGMVRVVWWEEGLLLVLGYNYVHGCSNQIIYSQYIKMQISIGFNFSLFHCVMEQSQCCLCKYYTMHASLLKLI